ncbi:tyrosine-protein phosphatase [Metabacillus arenae]|uniref:Tyrosine-protein phosphatase n=1 Tax=Metabacillus arenae TaxID=2771434 RepID=A0A926NEA8_9BACI|nr:CpsB/CapC family capsule biosynthesis tyrosine phosphatase [Metabacillus arenae]MBD1382672.1 tyrosine protein phosphatase [Metabacillus arenae]
MIDIHSHILPDVDDGAKSIEESIEMAKQAVEEGITQIIATPHHRNGRWENEKQLVLEKVDQLNHLFIENKIPLTVLPGQEVRIFGEIAKERSDLLTLVQSNYLLIEFPSNHVPRYAEQLIFDLGLKGITPIIAHPERNSEISENPDLLFKLVKKGALSQLTAASAAGGFGKKAKKLSMQLIEANLVHFIASDAHNTGNRNFQMQAGLQEVKKEFGNSVIYYFQENSELLVNKHTIYREDPMKVKKKKFLGIF